MSTVRRDKLRRLAETGRLEIVGSYHFDDQYGAARDTAKDMPVAIAPADWRDRKSGICYLGSYEFTGSGRAYENPDGTITLYVHSNSNYTFRVVEPKKVAA